MSILGKKWIIKNTSSHLSTLEKILENREVTLHEELTLHDPYLFKDMEKAVARIDQALDNQERIIIFGDYDVDGITAAAILVHTLKKLNANISYRLPNRLKDGYGLSEKFIDEFIEKEVKLIITVDCGISCYDAIKKAKENGIDAIITDHHTIPKNIPEHAVAIIHPKLDNNYPYPELTGAGVSLKLAQALLKDEQELFTSLIDLASLGTVADLGPLTGENRFIVKKGLEVLAQTKWVGLKKIMNIALVKESDELDTNTIGFRIAPRINAAGRIGDPYIALSLLLEESENDKVNLLGSRLENLNIERQQMTESALNEAIESLQMDHNDPPILIAEHPDWHVGILGLIASKLAEKYGRPAIIMQDFGDMLVASGRSPGYFNITEALEFCKEYLVSYGGHAQAAGFNLKKENLINFRAKLYQYALQKMQNIDTKPVLEIDCELSENEMHLDFLTEIEQLKPFGIANKTPTFLIHKVEPLFIDQVGKAKEHLKFSIKSENKNIDVIAFQMGQYAEEIRDHRQIDLVFHLDRNKWNDRENLQIRALDFRKSEE